MPDGPKFYYLFYHKGRNSKEACACTCTIPGNISIYKATCVYIVTLVKQKHWEFSARRIGIEVVIIKKTV